MSLDSIETARFLEADGGRRVCGGRGGNRNAYGGCAGPGRFVEEICSVGDVAKDLSDADKFALAKACGFEGVEGSPMADLEAAKKLGETARGRGDCLHSISYGGWEAPMSSADPDVIAKGQKAIEVALRSAKAMGAETVLLVSAVVDAKTSYDAAYERSQKKHSSRCCRLPKNLR